MPKIAKAELTLFEIQDEARRKTMRRYTDALRVERKKEKKNDRT